MACISCALIEHCITWSPSTSASPASAHNTIASVSRLTSSFRVVVGDIMQSVFSLAAVNGSVISVTVAILSTAAVAKRNAAFSGVPALHCNSKEPMPMKSVLLAACLLSSTLVFAGVPQSELPVQPTGITGRITATSVWQMPATFLPAAHKACDKAPNPPSFTQCFIAQMSKAGAPPAAVAFTQELLKQSGGDFGIMSGIQCGRPG